MKYGPKKQHIVPKAYLKGFCNKNGQLSYFDRKQNKIHEDRNPRSVCIEKNIYTIENGDDKNYIIERVFSEIEGYYPDILLKIEKVQTLSDKELHRLIEYFCMQYMRTQHSLRSISARRSRILKDNNFIKGVIDDIYTKERKKYPYEQIKEKVGETVENELSEKPSKNGTLLSMIDGIRVLHKYIWEFYDVLFIYSPPRKKFITSDYPAIRLFGEINDPFTKKIDGKAILFFPLSQVVGMILTPKKYKYSRRQISYVESRDYKFIKHMNYYMIHLSDRMIITSSKNSIERLIKKSKLKP